MKINIVLALTSAVFMTTWVTGPVSIISSSMSIPAPYPMVSDLLASDSIFIAITGLLSIISFSGSLLFLAKARKTLSRWYLSIPLSISLFVFFIVNLLVYFEGKSFLGAPISITELFWIIMLTLLAPCSVLFFISSSGHDSSTKAYVTISAAASIFSMPLLFFTLREILRWAGHETLLLPLAFYWTILMPAIGICLLSKTTVNREGDNIREESDDTKEF